MVFVFLCHVEGELLPYSDEAKAFRWVSVDKLKELLQEPGALYPMHVETLKKYVRSLEDR
ncbi:MAG TPA: hypothetical protein VN366_11460 [Feifaniaceae bacterium]|nr:hypothetical protein [Feifaniaceae bacterium]